MQAGDDPRIVSLIQSGQTLQAIKLYRELTGAGLAEAKNSVEQMVTVYGSPG